ncbi:hypothetical protein ACFL2Q_20245 [Thermodesulfobacteriota bacterium]
MTLPSPTCREWASTRRRVLGTAAKGLLEGTEFAYNRVQGEENLFCHRSTLEETHMT